MTDALPADLATVRLEGSKASVVVACTLPVADEVDTLTGCVPVCVTLPAVIDAVIVELPPVAVQRRRAPNAHARRRRQHRDAREHGRGAGGAAVAAPSTRNDRRGHTPGGDGANNTS